MTSALCPVLAADQQNIITSSNVNSLLPSTRVRTPGTRVSVACYVPTSYTLRGPAQLVCGTNGQWSPGVPSCVPKSSSNNSNNNNNDNNSGGEPPDDNSVSSTASSEGETRLSNEALIIIGVASLIVLILIILILIFLCKYFGTPGKDLDEMKQPISVHFVETPTRPKLEFLKVDKLFSSPLPDIYRGPNSPPAWHHHPVIMMAHTYKQRSLTQLSVDQYLREIEASRRKNPNHSWRDFASLYSYYTRTDSIV